MTSLLGIDNGLTVTKAVVFDIDGTVLSVARRRVPQLMPAPHWVERDMAALWQATAEAVAEALALSGRPAADIAAVAATAAGDGMYLMDRAGQPLGPAILSLDSRAGGVVHGWAGLAEEALRLTGQVPHASAPSAVLAWIRDHQPDRFDQIGHVIFAKDWLRYCLTGQIATDPTDASTAFTHVQTQTYAPEIMALYGLQALQGALPPILGCGALAGYVTPQAAALTGLVAGTPVATGLHDVPASALGIGGHAPGVAAIVAGTYSINEVVSTRPVVDARWFCRNGVMPGTWNNQAISPASAANYDWFLETLCAADLAAHGANIHAVLGAELAEAMARPSSLLFHPYLFGSPHGPVASAGFVGLRGWHKRGDMLRAVVEGIAFNHRVHIDALRDAFPMTGVRLTGGISRNPLIAQIFADVLNLPVTTSTTAEAAAWGAALCAGAAIGAYASPLHDPRDMSTLGQTHAPLNAAAYQPRYAMHNQLTRTLAPIWPELEVLAHG